MGTTWAMREIGFACITWCPKATVQAALSGVALDFVRQHPQFESSRADAELLLTTGVLSIVMTAPLFAVAMHYAGRAWLEKEEREEPYLNCESQPPTLSKGELTRKPCRKPPRAGWMRKRRTDELAVNVEHKNDRSFDDSNFPVLSAPSAEIMAQTEDDIDTSATAPAASLAAVAVPSKSAAAVPQGPMMKCRSVEKVPRSEHGFEAVFGARKSGCRNEAMLVNETPSSRPHPLGVQSVLALL
mmetsp:Transcript_54105/g.89804  ORF Transcript_54105/g.89804 Transcript_54105/m.89804 type:complete len:243 (-) Transcript_54105:371-1099(-)